MEGLCCICQENGRVKKRRTDLEPDSTEMVCVKIFPAKAKNTIFSEMYKDFEKDVLAKLSDETSKDVIRCYFNGEL